MKTTITVREYARLTTDPVVASMDRAQVSTSAFDWLCKLNASFSRKGASLLQVEGRQWLRLDNYVGVLETPCGTCLEILPKHTESEDCPIATRALLRKMIQAALNLPTRDAGVAALELYDSPLSEWVMRRFLEELDFLVKRGIRFDYQRVEEERSSLRGQLNLVAQIRQPPGRQQFFQVRHDVFVPDRAENRLLRLAVERICKATQDAANWRLAHELRSLMLEVPVSRLPSEDFRHWRVDRLMAHYQSVKPWCELVLGQHMPLAVAGNWHGVSLLFPMEKIFERYVAAALAKELVPGAKLVTQKASEYLCTHCDSPFFRLEPDLYIQQGKKNWVLDTKWKRLDVNDQKGRYGLSQGDFYQLFAYGHKYLPDGKGELVLIYPKRSVFGTALPVFDFGGGLTLRVLPFNLESAKLVDGKLTSLPMKRGDVRPDTSEFTSY
ncbi:McrC family protein [Pseudomonas psychrophila]|uniref:McrC family protein n=1 Tax=Pseudomonas psychrophila TaxID=122355 RepID=UPI000357930D|nr:McrC family protein [Pseudomonas psychrophila]EPJ95156.1 hypothetical protein CF149_07319 [Pseudomonas psychrophila]